LRSAFAQANRRLCLCISELDSELKLEHARQVHLSGGLTEIGISNVRIDASETNIIEEVERISPEHKP
jgi:hypothetical protein